MTEDKLNLVLEARRQITALETALDNWEHQECPTNSSGPIKASTWAAIRQLARHDLHEQLEQARKDFEEL